MDYIDIKGYKSIKELRLELKPINVLIGANGAGKSNFISFFDFLKAAYKQTLRRTVAKNGGVDKFLHNGRKQTEQLSCTLSFENEKIQYGFTLEAGIDFFVVTNERQQDWEIDAIDNPDAPSSELLIRFSTHDPKLGAVRSHLEGLKVYHFHDTGVNSPFNSDKKTTDCVGLHSDGANLAAFLYNLRLNDLMIYNRIVKTIGSIAPYFLDFDLNPNTLALGGEYIRLAWQDKYSENRYDATDFSDGTIRFIALAALFLQPNPPEVIIIDEPELGLHPFAISKLAGLIQSVASKGTQVIVSTQSVELVNCFAPEDIIVVDNINGQSTFERLDSSKLSIWLNDYAIGELWRQNILGKGFPNR